MTVFLKKGFIVALASSVVLSSYAIAADSTPSTASPNTSTIMVTVNPTTPKETATAKATTPTAAETPKSTDVKADAGISIAPTAMAYETLHYHAKNIKHMLKNPELALTKLVVVNNVPDFGATETALSNVNINLKQLKTNINAGLLNYEEFKNELCDPKVVNNSSSLEELVKNLKKIEKTNSIDPDAGTTSSTTAPAFPGDPYITAINNALMVVDKIITIFKADETLKPASVTIAADALPAAVISELKGVTPAIHVRYTHNTIFVQQDQIELIDNKIGETILSSSNLSEKLTTQKIALTKKIGELNKAEKKDTGRIECLTELLKHITDASTKADKLNEKLSQVQTKFEEFKQKTVFVGNDEHVLALTVNAAGGIDRNKTNIISVFTGNRGWYLGGSSCTYFLFDSKGNILSSDTLSNMTGFIQLKEQDKFQFHNENFKDEEDQPEKHKKK